MVTAWLTPPAAPTHGVALPLALEVLGFPVVLVLPAIERMMSVISETKVRILLSDCDRLCQA